MDPEVVEIVGNTLEMSQLHVQDAMIPRNQVQILDDQDSLEENMEIARTCGHTRLPLCTGNLDHCSGIIHVKYALGHQAADPYENIHKMHPSLYSCNPTPFWSKIGPSWTSKPISIDPEINSDSPIQFRPILTQFCDHLHIF